MKKITIKVNFPFEISNEVAILMALFVEREDYDTLETYLKDNDISFNKVTNGFKTEYSFSSDHPWWKKIIVEDAK